MKIESSSLIWFASRKCHVQPLPKKWNLALLQPKWLSKNTDKKEKSLKKRQSKWRGTCWTNLRIIHQEVLMHSLRQERCKISQCIFICLTQWVIWWSIHRQLTSIRLLSWFHTDRYISLSLMLFRINIKIYAFINNLINSKDDRKHCLSWNSALVEIVLWQKNCLKLFEITIQF